MNAPFYQFGLFGPDTSLIVAMVIGVAFGFALERAGLGNGCKLAAQFYLTDLTVFKVMFTAIVTAMTGLYLLSAAGVLDLSLIFRLPTYLVPHLVGGLLFGVGFVVGGYCPGTSCVAASTGRLDGLVLILGMMTGIWIFVESYPLLEGFVNLSPMGEVDVPTFLHLPHGAVVLLVVILAVCGFLVADRIERAHSIASPHSD
jgi:uncharacterized membrane protein YedE/YeeE